MLNIMPHTFKLLRTFQVYAVQFLVDMLLLPIEKLDLLIYPVSDGIVHSFYVLLFAAVDFDMYVIRFDLLHFTRFVEPYCGVGT